MADRRSDSPDPFAPADVADPHLVEPLQLAERNVSVGRPTDRPAGTLADPADVSGPGSRSISGVRKPVTYKRPDGGVGTYMLWALAVLGLGVVVVFGARLLRGTVEGRAAAAKPAAMAAPAPAAPVHWTAVNNGDNVLITIDVQPRQGARLLLDGAPMPSNPVSLPRGSKHTITGLADGFDASDLDVTADAPKAVRLKLHRAGR